MVRVILYTTERGWLLTAELLSRSELRDWDIRDTILGSERSEREKDESLWL